MNPRIVGIAGPLRGTLFALPEGESSLGRDSTNQIWASDAFLSRRHCTLTRSGAEIFVRDLKSHNGTRVNGIPVTEQKLQHGDQISVGDSLLGFLIEEDEGIQKSNPVSFENTAEFADSGIQLRPEDTIYLRTERTAGALSVTPRLTRDLNSLLKLATAIGGIRDRESLQWQLLGFLFDVVPAERGAVLYFDPAGEVSSTAAWDRARGPEYPVPINEGLVKRVWRERTGLVVSEGLDAAALRDVKTPGATQIRSLLCVPLVHSDRVSGAIYLDTRSLAEPFDEDHLQIMGAVASIAALAVDNLKHWEQLREENRELRAEISLEHDMIGGSPRMKEVFEFVRRAAPTDSTVLILGESGTGKELVARAIHRNSGRTNGPFVAINCAAIAETLLESELFGHEKGAFTGAVARKKGKMEMADGGTLFLDEISELAVGLQAKLLRVLQEREFERVGGTGPIPLDIRLVAASNRSLVEAAEAGEFRKDLYYRLNVVALSMPALRERSEDIAQLAEHFVAKASRKIRVRPKEISAEAHACLREYDWPGNVRELENAMERALVLGSGEAILVEDLPEAIAEGGETAAVPTARFLGAVKESKKQLILQALQQAKGSYIDAAKGLGIHPNSLLRLIRNLGIKAAVKAAAPPTRGM